MATIHKNLSEIGTELPSAADMRIGIVVSEWNEQITGALLEGAVRTLKNAGCDEQNIEVKRVPGTFELSLGAQFFAEYTDVDGVIVLGCVDPGRDAAFRLRVPGRYAGRYAVDAVVEHAGGLRGADD